MELFNFNTSVKSLSGNDIIERAPDRETGEIVSRPVLMSDIAFMALQTSLPDDNKLNPKQKIELISLALKIHNSDEVSLTRTEVDLLRNRVNKLPNCSHIVTYRFCEFIKALD